MRAHSHPAAMCGRLRLLALLLALLPGAGGECGPPPPVRGARPADPATSFPEGASVTYECLAGLHKLPGMVQTRLCLRGSTWSPLEPFCDRSCSSPARARFAQLSEEDERKSFYPVGSTVRYICRPGYENVTATQPTSTCLENVTWSDIPELCKRKSCGAPKGPEHGRAAVITDFLFGARMNIICDPGYQLIGRPSISCRLKGNQVAWSDLPTCQIMATQPATSTSDPPGRADVGVNSTAVMTTRPATPKSNPPGRADVGVNSTVMATLPATPTSDPPGRADMGVNSTDNSLQTTPGNFTERHNEDPRNSAAILSIGLFGSIVVIVTPVGIIAANNKKKKRGRRLRTDPWIPGTGCAADTGSVSRPRKPTITWELHPCERLERGTTLSQTEGPI
ncbi:complement decay-accelerating factor-like isoform X3 [Alligator mississippiensis]|uniref:complement decay-accelerating factor-like isoform X3 n=1 Tax=Alligator mississippiensis TaxID=8496 RepID=UPI0028777EF3|nr:complement decay-accelerating factor-like isoform X3 [Alligator mississippiensis]